MANKQYVGWIYIIRNKINNKLYVGRTNNYQRRYNEHFGKRDTCTILRKAFEKYGKENFEMFPILSFKASNSQVLDETLNLLEKYYIQKYETYKKGYNATLGGDGNCGWVVLEETRRKRSKSLTGRKISDKERARLLSYVKNRKWTKEQKEHHRQIILNRDKEIYKKVAEKLRGRKIGYKPRLERRKPVLQYSLEGDFIKEYNGAIALGIKKEGNIIACCQGKLNSAYGYVWKFKISNNYPMKIEKAVNTHQSNVPILQYDKIGNLIAEFVSATSAAEITSIGRRAISNCLCNRSKSAGGYIWKYKNRKEVNHA